MRSNNKYSYKLDDGEIEEFLKQIINCKDFTSETTLNGDGTYIISAVYTTEDQSMHYIGGQLQDYECKFEANDRNILKSNYNAIYRKMMLEKYKDDPTYPTELIDIMIKERKKIQEEYARKIALLDNEESHIFGVTLDNLAKLGEGMEQISIDDLKQEQMKIEDIKLIPSQPSQPNDN